MSSRRSASPACRAPSSRSTTCSRRDPGRGATSARARSCVRCSSSPRTPPGELDSYIDAGRLLVAVQGDEVVGHLQLIETGRPSKAEVKNTAVLSPLQRRGVGRALVAAAIDIARDEGRSTLIVATATADIGNLRFYQRVGFRMSAIKRDAFTEASGYVPGLHVDGIALRDRLWLDLDLAA